LCQRVKQAYKKNTPLKGTKRNQKTRRPASRRASFGAQLRALARVMVGGIVQKKIPGWGTNDRKGTLKESDQGGCKPNSKNEKNLKGQEGAKKSGSTRGGSNATCREKTRDQKRDRWILQVKKIEKNFP